MILHTEEHNKLENPMRITFFFHYLNIKKKWRNNNNNNNNINMRKNYIIFIVKSTSARAK